MLSQKSVRYPLLGACDHHDRWTTHCYVPDACGVNLFGTHTGYAASFFVEAEQAASNSEMLLYKVRQLREKIEESEKRIK